MLVFVAYLDDIKIYIFGLKFVHADLYDFLTCIIEEIHAMWRCLTVLVHVISSTFGNTFILIFPISAGIPLTSESNVSILLQLLAT